MKNTSEYLVYHDRYPLFRNLDRALTLEMVKKGSGFDLVAAVRARSLDEAFVITSSTDWEWPQHPKVTPLFRKDNYRSTAVGDVIVDPRGNGYYVLSFGWAVLPKTLMDCPA